MHETFEHSFLTHKAGVVKDGVQWSEGDSWPIGERAEGAGTVGGVEREG